MSADEQAPPVDWGEQLAEASAFVLDDIKQKWKQMNGGPSVLDSLKEFAAAVDWSVSPHAPVSQACIHHCQSSSPRQLSP